jgi:N-acyl-D-amino-acid deacylase
VSGITWEELLWYVFPLGQKPDYEPDREQSIAGIAKAQGKDSFEVMYDLMTADGGKELFYQPLNAYANYDFSFFEETLTDPDALFGLSDGGAHCGLIADAGMPSFVLTHWVRDREKGKRLVQQVDGYRYTFKSGVETFIDGEHTGALPGRLVRGGQGAARL